jgi:hypothetical protein
MVRCPAVLLGSLRSDLRMTAGPRTIAPGRDSASLEALRKLAGDDPHPGIAFGDVVPPHKGEGWSKLQCSWRGPQASFRRKPESSARSAERKPRLSHRRRLWLLSRLRRELDTGFRRYDVIVVA